VDSSLIDCSTASRISPTIQSCTKYSDSSPPSRIIVPTTCNGNMFYEQRNCIVAFKVHTNTNDRLGTLKSTKLVDNPEWFCEISKYLIFT
jgi:hypothetical protein